MYEVFSKDTIYNLRPILDISVRHQQRALDVTLACKLTHVYGKYHLAMLHRELAMSEERTTYQRAELQAAMMNQITVFQSSPSDFLHTQEESTDESIDTYKKFKQFYGMSSTLAQEKFGNGKPSYRASEGRVTLMPYTGSVYDVIEELLGGLRSTMTYIGAWKLKNIPKQCVFYKVYHQLNQSYENYTVGK